MAPDLVDAAALVAGLETRRPGAYQLARVLSLAARIEFPLLRRARLLLPDLDASAEADLCGSEIIASQTPQGFLLDPGVAEILRRHLADNERLLDEAWRLVSAAHRDAAWPIRSEEQINRLSLSRDPADAERIQQLLLATAREMVDADNPTAAAQWTMRALMRLPSSASGSDAGRAIQAGVAVRLDGSLDLEGAELPSDAFENWFPWLLGREDEERLRPVPVSLLDGFLELGGAGDAGTIRLPNTKPLIVDLGWHDGLGPHNERVTFNVDKPCQVRVTAEEIELRAIDGRGYRLRARRQGPVARGGIDFSAVRARHRPFLDRQRELEKVLDQLTRTHVAIAGEAGVGKTALLCGCLDAIEARGDRVLTHFMDGGPDEWRHPDVIEASLLAQMAGWSSSSTGSGDTATLASELSRHAETGPFVVLLDGLERGDDALKKLEELLESLPRSAVRLVWTGDALEPDRYGAARMDLNEREANEALCREYLRVHREGVERAIVRETAAQPRRPRVFLLHSSREVGANTRVIDALAAGEIEVLADQQSPTLASGEPFSTQAARAIRDSDAVVLVATDRTVQSPYVQHEVAEVLALGKPLIPVAVERIDSMPDVFRTLQFITADSGDEWRGRLVELVRQVSRRVQPELLLLGRANGNIGRVVSMHEWIRAQPAGPVDLSRMPPVLYGEFDSVWESVKSSDGFMIAQLAGILAAAREPLPHGAEPPPPPFSSDRDRAERALKALESAGLATVRVRGSELSLEEAERQRGPMLRHVLEILDGVEIRHASSVQMAANPVHRRAEEVRSLVGDNRVLDAFQRLTDFVRDFSEDAAVLQEVIALGADYERLEQEERPGALPQDRLALLSHERVRQALAAVIEPSRMSAYHDMLAQWGESYPPYGLRHTLSHLIDAGRIDQIQNRVTDAGFLTRIAEELGVDNLEAQLADVRERIHRR